MSRKAATAPRCARPAEGERIYVIGDVHGEMNLLSKLLNRILQDDLGREPRKKRLLFLGDLIDRGPASADVLAMVHSAQKETESVVVLMGNHESALLGSLNGNVAAQQMWLRHGGRETLASFGIAPPAEDEDPHSFALRLKMGIPDDLVEWLGKLPLSFRSGSYFFCHAGVRPGTELAKQKPEDLLWIGEEFLSSQADHGAIVVHGHSICGDAVEFASNRIGVDTGAYASGILSAVGLDGDDSWVISTAETSRKPVAKYRAGVAATPTGQPAAKPVLAVPPIEQSPKARNDDGEPGGGSGKLVAEPKAARSRAKRAAKQARSRSEQTPGGLAGSQESGGAPERATKVEVGSAAPRPTPEEAVQELPVAGPGRLHENKRQLAGGVLGLALALAGIGAAFVLSSEEKVDSELATQPAQERAYVDTSAVPVNPAPPQPVETTSAVIRRSDVADVSRASAGPALAEADSSLRSTRSAAPGPTAQAFQRRPERRTGVPASSSRVGFVQAPAGTVAEAPSPLPSASAVAPPRVVPQQRSFSDVELAGPPAASREQGAAVSASETNVERPPRVRRSGAPVKPVIVVNSP